MQIDWVDIKREDRTVNLDIRYGRQDNFLRRKFYPTEDAFLHRPVSEDLLRAHREFKELGFGILIFDAYRPFSVTKAFWDLADLEQKNYLANPAKGSNHNRGCAVDCSLYSLESGEHVTMPSDFDEMNEKAWVNFTGGTSESRKVRDLFIEKMQSNGFKVASNEWWHFDHPLRFEMPISDLSFKEIHDLIG